MFWTRLISGIVLVLIALAGFWAGGPLLCGLLLFISLVAYLELVKAVGIQEDKKRWNPLTICGLLGVVIYYGVVYFGGDETLELMVIMGVMLATLFVYVVTFPKYRAEQAFGTFFAFVYAPVMFAFMYLTRQLNYGGYIVWMILISSWGCDTCAYAVGMLMGKHKIFPVLSPKKSLEGCIGGVVGSMLIGFLFSFFVLDQVVTDQAMNWIVVLICGVGAVFSQIGDLAASAIKRNHQIKDYGHLIPGHGGIMDRFDSVIVTAPMIYFMAVLLIK